MDGTKEFISGNGEFTVNIGLVECGKPAFGVIYAPVNGLLYWGSSITAARETFEKRDFANIAAKNVNSILIAFCQNSTPVNSPLHRGIQEESQTCLLPGREIQEKNSQISCRTIKVYCILRAP
jgi:3'-phosphoadenosine 5'-phosphosulfate (PAPS) 3'-phosphatase